jgi:hypothetical protein
MAFLNGSDQQRNRLTPGRGTLTVHPARVMIESRSWKVLDSLDELTQCEYLVPRNG